MQKIFLTLAIVALMGAAMATEGSARSLLSFVEVEDGVDVASNSQNFPLQKLSYKLPASWECPDIASMDVQEADKWCANKDRSKPFCTQSVKRREGGFKAVMFDTVFVCSNQPGSTPRICHTRSDEQCAPYAGLGGNWGKCTGYPQRKTRLTPAFVSYRCN